MTGLIFDRRSDAIGQRVEADWRRSRVAGGRPRPGSPGGSCFAICPLRCRRGVSLVRPYCRSTEAFEGRMRETTRQPRINFHQIAR
jgi:hypothetical protein